ncbi:hypothetical protein LRP67_02360 [Nocardioides sp. cx-169]|uniref:hypothetical protein n=1 Tax=Nocardioides sp. cx-169 TaxID=2899080 RepID=UPI001E514EA7|nr:hypothetical protein [Nocardioides sp. cx-169]MCD4532924.1 hypothetical protein [Nocardioides sp. cx-169]
MSTIEDRLTRTLAARADQVGPEDLRPAEVPQARVSWLRHPATYAVAAAACAAAIAAPFLVDLGDGEPAPNPPAVSPQPDIGGGWEVVEQVVRVDVDGDGTADRVRVRQEPGQELIGPRLRVEADLTDGERVFGIVPSGEVGYGVPQGVQLDNDPGRELILYRDGLPFAVLDLVDGRLAEPSRPSRPPLLNGIVPADDGRGRESALWVDGETLLTYLTVDTFSGGEPLSLPPEYAVDVTRWSLDDGTLVPTSLGEQCLDAVDGPTTPEGMSVPAPCADGRASPALFPAAEDTVGPGESFEIPLGADTFTVALEEADGSTWLVVDIPGSGEQRVSLPGSGTPTVFTSPVRMSDVELSVLVAQESGDSTAMTLVTVRGGRLVVALTSGQVPFGGGFQDPDARSFQTWIGPDNRLFTRLKHAGSDEYDVWSWSLGGSVSVDGPPTLQPAAEGCFVLDNRTPPAETRTCAD